MYPPGSRKGAVVSSAKDTLNNPAVDIRQMLLT